jgi:hypothetical protein
MLIQFFGKESPDWAMPFKQVKKMLQRIGIIQREM